MQTTVLLARHGQTDWNAERRWQGHADRPLTELGRAQAEELADRLESVELRALYASDLRRARETAEVVAARKGHSVTPLAELREVDVGSWSGLTREEAAERHPQEFARWRNGGPGWTDGETYEHMSRRVLKAVLGIANDHAGFVLVVTHAGPIRAVHAAALGIDVQEYRRVRPVEPNARLSAVCLEARRFTELCPASELDDLLERDRAARRAAAAGPPSPAG